MSVSLKDLIVRDGVIRQSYTVRMNAPRFPFALGMVWFGSLTPWRGAWYWSGE